jgi:hypothetical protein
MVGAELQPIALREARRFIADHHRHSVPPRGWLFGVALVEAEQLIAVGVAGRPTGRGLQDGRTIEVTRVCSLGSPNACSRVYGALCRAAAALGYQRAISYTLASEAGTSLRAAGFRQVAELDARTTWTSEGRPRYDGDLWGTSSVGLARVRWQRDL